MPFRPDSGNPHRSGLHPMRNQVKSMKDQNAPMWRNGQTPSSQGQSGSQNDAERQAQQQNQKSEQNKRSH
ncbi:MAG: hypothetical protein IK134_00285 [Oscillospiraceae bacterium]|nr:hypothetical protein [Oscillospiraceae bacterium]MBQ9905674.1 hypothetical protein [Oscillospiraceae bacterium]MBR5361752.1 hypothetical protein [Oscillospiraceae bacterium]